MKTEKERYPAEWSDVPSVTEVLRAFPSPELLRWFKQQAFADIKAKSDRGKDIGKTLHELRIKIESGEPFSIVTKYPEEIQNCLKSYMKWKKERNIPPIILSEIKMYSKRLKFKGTLDDIAGNLELLILLEHKTSSGIYDDAREQAVAYKQLFESSDTVFLGLNGNTPNLRKISSIWITRFPKDKPDFETQEVKPEEEMELLESFQHKLAIYSIRKRRQQNAKNNGER
jgi:hypothetical protein